eukprot:TRINITY_DN39952_c0_g1_i1.p1 TRINITY_DN39952_c0_g1~~TRINITY_DN39952_c0_g1_i1.p1  ORF type:complete len:247 (-),score=81.48 TRINITY_DN39952_c0_g1_i1:420-1160(-)
MVLHPELRSRLEKLGIGASQDHDSAASEGGAQGAAEQLSRSPSSPEADPGSQQQQQSVVKAPSNHHSAAHPSGDELDDLLLQLDDLDARSRSLQKEAQRDAAKARKEDVAKKQDLEKETQRKELVGGEDERSTSESAAEAIARQHPLQGLSNVSSNFKRPAVRQRQKPPAMPHTPSGTSAAKDRLRCSQLQLGTANASGDSSAVPASPASARGSRAPGGSIVLPQLKPSASAPGCLISGPWLRNIR